MPASKESSELTLGGRIIGTLFFLAFFLMGSFFEFLIIREFIGLLKSYSWQKTPCRILSSEVVSEDGDYRFAVRYEYVVNSKTYIGEKFRRNFHDGDHDKQYGRTLRYPAGSGQSCFVNPDNPTEALLERDNLLFGLLILFPLLFIGIGTIGIYAMLARFKSKDQKARPISDSSKGRWFLAAFLSIFALAGLGMMWPLCFRPIYKVIDARTWMEIPCKILHAQVRSHDGDDGTTYSVDILYEYVVDGKTRQSARYDFLGGSSSGYRGKQAVVDRYKSMSNPVCYVNPVDPSESVLLRKPTLKLLLCLVPWVFFLVGAGGIYGVVRSAHRSAQGGSAAWLPNAPAAQRRTGPDASGWLRDIPAGDFDSDWIPLPVARRRIGGFFGRVMVALFWNGLVSIFVVIAVQSFRRGDPEWFLTIFIIPFVLIGIFLILAAIHGFLALFNPYPVVQIRPARIPLGGSANLRWEFKGFPGRIRELKILLIAAEQIRTTYDEKERKQKMGMSSRPVFEREAICLTDPQQIAAGQIRLSIPTDAMHSFDGGNCCLVWTVSFRGDIRIWPNLKDDLPIVVVPPNLPESK